MTLASVIAFSPLDHLVERVRLLLEVVAEGSLDFLLALVVALVGWALAEMAARLTRWLLRTLRFNEGARAVLGWRAQRPQQEPAAFASWVVYWLLLGVSLMLALDTLGLTLSIPVAERLADVLPRVVVAAVLLTVGVLSAMVLGALTRRLFVSGGLRGSRIQSQLVTGVLVGVAILIALEQLGFAAQFVMAVGVVAVGAIAFAVALAFGLGCRDLARDFVVEYLRSLEEERPGKPS